MTNKLKDSFAYSDALLDWYDRHHRQLPWRVAPPDAALGVVPDPYHVWLSEIMLQQTTVGAVKGYYEKFLQRWPGIEDLAASSEDDVLKAWAGLGYYSRARNLRKCAEAIVAGHDGKFPVKATELKKLPGIGDYTSAAIAAIAFDEQVAVVDGNIERIVSRLDRISEPLPGAKKPIKARMAELTPASRPGDFAQAMMDLGASLCSPKKPACALCPFTGACEAERVGDMERFPVKAPKKQKPTRRGAAFLITREGDGAIWLQKRPSRGLLASMTQVPTTDWTDKKQGEAFDLATALDHAPESLDFYKRTGQVTHTFTHFHLELDVYQASATADPMLEGWWSQRDEIAGEALPTIFRKVVEMSRE